MSIISLSLYLSRPHLREIPTALYSVSDKLMAIDVKTTVAGCEYQRRFVPPTFRGRTNQRRIDTSADFDVYVHFWKILQL